MSLYGTMERVKREVRGEKNYENLCLGALHRGRACDRGSGGPLGSGAVIQTFWLGRKACLWLVLNDVWLRCADVSEDSLVQAIKGKGQQAAGIPTCLWGLEVQEQTA